MSVQDNIYSEKTSPVVSEKIKSLFKGYLNLMLECNWMAEDDLKEFKADPHERLKGIGMKIPQNIPVCFDDKNLQKPAIIVIKGEKKFKSEEGILAVKAFGDAKEKTTKERDVAILEFILPKQGELNLKMDILEEAMISASENPEEAQRLIDGFFRKHDGLDENSDDSLKIEKTSDSIFSPTEKAFIEELTKNRIEEGRKNDPIIFVRLPYLNVKTDLLINYNWETQEDIILSCC